MLEKKCRIETGRQFTRNKDQGKRSFFLALLTALVEGQNIVGALT